MTTLSLIATLLSTLGAHRGAPAGAQRRPAARAGDSSDADAIRQRVREGQKVRVTDDQGAEWQGHIKAVAPDVLVLLTRNQQQRDIPYPAIIRIDRPHDTLANGALIGFVSGAVYGLAAVIAEEYASCDPGAFFCGNPHPAAYVAVPALVGAVGAGIGVGFDAVIRRDPTLFRRGGSQVRLAPLVGRKAGGVRLAVRW